MSTYLDPDRVAMIIADYRSGMRIGAVAKKYQRAWASIRDLLASRGVEIRLDPRGQGPKRLAPERAEAIVAEYTAGVSVAELGRRYERSGASIRGLLQSRGVVLRYDPRTAALKFGPDGRVLPFVPATADELAAMVAAAKRIAVPASLRLEWRHWNLSQRANFIGWLREKLKSPEDRPLLPFSSNVEPFDYGSEKAHEMMAEINKGLSSRHWKGHIKATSQGVIWSGHLWFWVHDTGYVRGPYNPVDRRPQLNRVIYETTHGVTLDSNDTIRAHDGNPNNLDPENLFLCPRERLLRENQAKALTRKSREHTRRLLNLVQNPDDNAQTLHRLSDSLR